MRSFFDTGPAIPGTRKGRLGGTMKVTSAEYVKSALEPKDFPRDRLPEFAFAGRSNVGKSSLLNRLLNRKGLAKTSKSPGKTRTINFFLVNDRMYFVDLPGYGYAKVSKSLRHTWGRMITSYLTGREPLRFVAHLIDARHPPTPNDHELLELLSDAEVPTLLVATKVDKLSKNQVASSLATIRRAFSLDSDALVVPFSSVTGAGVRELGAIVDEHL
jgi:GTP-binding protein